MQILQPPSTTTYQTEQGHFIKTFLISTKFNEAGWAVSKDTFREKVKSFLGKPFVIIPDHLSSERQKGHIFANTREALLNEYKKHTHGIINHISDPVEYNDGTGDLFCEARVKLNDSKAASALLEHGTKTWDSFAVSPHIWTFDGNDIAADWEGISLSLVPKGAYGQEAVVNKYCKGDVVACSNSLAAALCDKEDSLAASTISSLLSQNQSKDIMSTVQVQEVKDVLPNNAQQVSKQEQPIKEEQNKGVTLSQEEYESLKKEVEAKKQLNEQVTVLLNENKTTKLNGIFKSVKDESLKKTLVEKYFNADVNQLNDFYADVTNHIFPSLVEEAKAQAESELKTKLTEENKGKSKAGSLPAEPVKEDTSKAAGSIVPKSVNEILKMKRMLEVGF